MATELIILFDGDSEALRAHRLSLAELGKSLQLLLDAVWRTASGIVGQASDDRYGERRGRHAELAKRLDLQITAIRDGCVQIAMECVQAPRAGEELRLPGLDLPAETLQRLLDDLQAEADGRARNAAVRKFLESLPKHITRQRYVARVHGSERCVNLGEVRTPSSAEGRPRLVKLVGAVAGVVFEAGKETVSIRAGKQRTTLRATAELVEKALAMRVEPAVQATILDVQPPRLLRLDVAGAAVGGTPEQRWDAISTRWAETFAELAK